MTKSNRQRERLTLKARYVFPGTAEPIPDGAVTIQGERIVEVGNVARRPEAEDLGNVAILPGLVNAHTHLEFSDLAQPLEKPGTSFPDWIQSLVAFRLQSRRTSPRPVEQGLRECARLGTTTLGEIAQPGWPVGLFESAGLDATVFLELIAPTGDRVGPALELARRHLSFDSRRGFWRKGLSPHAPYSVRPELLAAAVKLSVARRVPIAFHLAESREELELIYGRTGPLRGFLSGLGAWDPTAFRLGTRPLDYLRILAAADRTLVIHGNYLDDEEIAFLAEHADRMAVVYCPRTHAHFAHDKYPLEKMLSAGVTTSVGTDSRASSPDLSVLAELRFVAQRYPDVGGGVVLRLGTISAARALGREHQLGSLEPGKYANMAVVALPEREVADPHELLFDSHEPVVTTWHRGAIQAES